MPSGSGAVNVNNVPRQAYRIDPAYFDQYTERNIYSPFEGDPVPTNPPGSGSSLKLHRTLDKVGVVPIMSSLISASLVTTLPSGSTLTAGYRWPWSLFRYTISGNGSTNFIDVDGMFLFVRDVVVNPGWTPNAAKYAVTFGTAGSYPIELFQDVPVAMDMVTLTGALYAQARGTSVAVDIAANSTTEEGIITAAGGATAVMSTNSGVTLGVEFYSVPFDQQKDQLVVPDIELLHGLTDETQYTSLGSKADIDLQPFVGQLERLYFWWDNNGVLVPSSAYTEIQFKYAGTQNPLSWTGPQLRHRMDREIRGYSALADGIFVLDLVRWTPTRDVVLMDGVSSPRLHLETSGVTWAGSPYVRYAVENLFV